MHAAPPYTEDLLDPVSPDQPAGSDLRWTTDWDRIKEARRADDALDSGKWAKKDRKAADWRLAAELAATMLRERSKDLQLALWLTEANIKLYGMPGLREGLRVTRELMVRYWDKGLFPAMEDGPEDRAGPFEWLSNKLVDAIATIPITDRPEGGADYSYADQQDALRVGSEANCRTADGEIDAQKRKAYDQALADGHVSMEQFESAVRETRRADYEALSSVFQETYDEFKALEKVVDEKFGDMAPNLSACRGVFNGMKQAIADILEKKRIAEPDPAPDAGSTPDGSGEPGARADGGDAVVVRFPLELPGLQESRAAQGGAWLDAEILVRSGQLEKGLAEMTRLAAQQYGRARFQQRLRLAEICLGIDRQRLAIAILEELAKNIDDLKLDNWESPELLGRVWGRLCRCYKSAEPGSAEAARAAELFDRLCRLDPWQALRWDQ